MAESSKESYGLKRAVLPVMMMMMMMILFLDTDRNSHF
jgi:hypothetical protein